MIMLRFVVILQLAYLITAIKVPVVQIEESTDILTSRNDDISSERPIYFESEESDVDSYLIPPNPHTNEESENDDKSTIATHLLPPPSDSKPEYYAPTEPVSQTDWYPLAQKQENRRPEQIFIPHVNDNINAPYLNAGKKNIDASAVSIPIPSQILKVPVINERIQYLPIPVKELEIPSVEIAKPFALPTPSTELQLPKYEANTNFNEFPAKKFQLKSIDPTLALYLVPPKPVAPQIYKNPTKLYPKKYVSGFKPIPIPISQYGDESNAEIPLAKPVKLIKPIFSSDEELSYPLDDKKMYLYEQAEQKRKHQQEQENNNGQEESHDQDPEQASAEEVSEQDMSESNYRRPVPIRESVPQVEEDPEQEEQKEEEPTAPAPSDRTEFHVHGLKGPHSYQFGFDTGKGKNRQFRYEERDNDGRVQGHYGYMDRSGKLRVVNYGADPEKGFHTE